MHYHFVSDILPAELQGVLNAAAAAGWRVHSIWQRIPDSRQPRRSFDPLVIYDVLLEYSLAAPLRERFWRLASATSKLLRARSST